MSLSAAFWPQFGMQCMLLPAAVTYVLQITVSYPGTYFSGHI